MRRRSTLRKEHTNLIRGHVEVDLHRARRPALIALVLVHGLARQDELRELLDARIEVVHRKTLVELLPRAQPALGRGCAVRVRRLLLCEPLAQLLNLLAVALEQGVGIDNLLLLRV